MLTHITVNYNTSLVWKKVSLKSKAEYVLWQAEIQTNGLPLTRDSPLCSGNDSWCSQWPRYSRAQSIFWNISESWNHVQFNSSINPYVSSLFFLIGNPHKVYATILINQMESDALSTSLPDEARLWKYYSFITLNFKLSSDFQMLFYNYIFE